MLFRSARFEIKSVDLLKVDIEGAEEELFARPQFLSRVKFVIIELHPPYSLERFKTDLRPVGFDAKPPFGDSGVPAVTAFPVT